MGGVSGDKVVIVVGMCNLSGWMVVCLLVVMVDMEVQGWQFVLSVVGFQKICEVCWLMVVCDVGDLLILVDQVVFMDGFVMILVFIELVEKNMCKEGVGSIGVMYVFVKCCGDYWIIVFGEVLLVMLQQFVFVIEYKVFK